MNNLIKSKKITQNQTIPLIINQSHRLKTICYFVPMMSLAKLFSFEFE